MQCIKMPDGIRCCRCRTMKQGCPRVVDFWITHVARQLGRPEAYVRDLYTLNTARRSEKTRGSTKEDEDSYVESGEDEASTVDDQEKIQFLPPSPKPNSSTSDPEVPLTPNDIELKQEIECKAWSLSTSYFLILLHFVITSVDEPCRDCRRQFCCARRSCPRFSNIIAI